MNGGVVGGGGGVGVSGKVGGGWERMCGGRGKGEGVCESVCVCECR